MDSPPIVNSLSRFKKLFFLKRNANKTQENPTNLRLTENEQKTRTLKLAKIKLASYRVINGHLLPQKSSNYLGHFFKNNINETNPRLFIKNPLGQNNLLSDPESLWNNFVGIKQERLSTFYLISRYRSSKFPGTYHIARGKKFKRAECRSFHISDLIFRM